MHMANRTPRDSDDKKGSLNTSPRSNFKKASSGNLHLNLQVNALNHNIETEDSNSRRKPDYMAPKNPHFISF